MSKEELVSQLTALVEGYTDGLVSANCRLINSGYKLKEEKQEWAQKYHMVMADNKGLEEQNGILQEKASSLATLNETLSAEAQNWQGRCAELQGQYSSVLKELAEKESSWSKAFAAAEERYEEKRKEITKLEYQVISAEERYQDLQDEFEASKRRQVEYHKKAENILATMGENLQKRQEQIEALTTWKEGTEKVLDSMEEKHEDFKTKSHGILATLEENLRKKQETIEALEVWKKGTESVLNTLEAKLKDAKDVIHTQENTIEWLNGRANWLDEKVKRLKAKKAKKEQND